MLWLLVVIIVVGCDVDDLELEHKEAEFEINLEKIFCVVD